jgi:hypothetical protein
MVTITLKRPYSPDIGERLDPGRIIRMLIAPFHEDDIRTEREQLGEGCYFS